ncbi:MAG: HDIG domain-containing protein [bacterium]|nr:HDIG domain-containing protein [bacterium]
MAILTRTPWFAERRDRLAGTWRQFATRLEVHRRLATLGTLLGTGGVLYRMQPSWWPQATWGLPLLADLLALALVLGTLGQLFVVYLRQFERRILHESRRFYFLALVILSTVAASGIMQVLDVSPFASPLGACAILLALFLGTRPAFVTSALLSVLISLAVGVHPGTPPWAGGMGLLHAAGAIAAILAVHRVRARADLARAGIYIALVQGAIAASLAGLAGLPLREVGHAAIAAGSSGVLSAIVAMGLLPYLEGLFEIVTPFKLLELANPAQPLLRLVLTKAPGTYHHSIMVGNLAEAAADAIGADGLLVRVGAYYHDIGKTKRPIFFVENQLGIENMHDKLNPRLSARVIIAHVEEGLELARQHRLPRDISDFIATHHGKSLVSYFLHQAEQAEGPDAVSEEGFRYPGPRPWTREQAIVMLADATEATMRTLKNPTIEQIEATVRRIIQKRLTEGELSEAPITLAELEIVAQTFIRITQGLYHQRIEYPDQWLKELGQRKQEGKKVGHLARG